MGQIDARQVLEDCVTLLPGQLQARINPLVHINAGRYAQRAALHDILPLYAAGPVAWAPVVLGRFPAPVRTDPPRFTFVMNGARLRFEPFDAVRDASEEARVIADLAASRTDVMRIEAPVLLAGRYGDHVWGHWLQQMLPKIVLAEKLCPGRFLYAVSATQTAPGGGRFAARVLESLAAYSVGPDRLLRLPPGYCYEFTNAHDILGVWQHGLHPGALAAMRRIVADMGADAGADVAAGAAPRVLAMRGARDMRAILNQGDVTQCLAARGFTAVDMAARDFLAQARLFAGAGVIAGELGSNLAALIYAPRGVRLLSFAPMDWIDSYFASTVQALEGFHADVRGASTLAGPDRKNAPFVVDPDDAAAGLAALLAARAGPVAVQVAGQDWPRAPGPPALALDFSAGSADLGLLRGAWHGAEGALSWAAGDHGAIEIPAARLPPGEYWLELRGATVAYPDYMPLRRIALWARDICLVRTECSGNLCVTARLPARLFTPGAPLSIRIDMPAVGRACDLGAAGDTRVLGAGIGSLRFYPAT